MFGLSLSSCATAPQARAPAGVPSAPFTLQWSAAVGCMDLATARNAIAQSLRTPDAARGAVVRVTIASERDGWNADVWMYGPGGSGERSVRGTSCKQVAEAVTLIVAMALDDAYTGEPRANRSAEPPEPQATEATAFEASVLAAGDIGSLPAPTVGFGLSLAVVLARWRLEGFGTAWLARDAHGGPVAGGGGSVALYAGGLRACYDAFFVLDHGMSLGPCLAAEAGAAVGRGFGIADPDAESNFWGAATAGISLRYLGLGTIRFGLLAEFGVPFRRPVWDVEEVPVFQAEPWLGRATFSASYLFR